jgi:hypothetical protein
MPCRSKNRQTALRLAPRSCARSRSPTSSKVRSGSAAISASSNSACSSSAGWRRPRRFAAALPVCCQRWTHLTAELALTAKRSPAARREAPPATASTTRSRKSPEHGFGIAHPPISAAARIAHPTRLENPPDSITLKSALVVSDSDEIADCGLADSVPARSPLRWSPILVDCRRGCRATSIR